MAERLQKLLSQWGVASRRQAEGLISAGRVRLNGRVAQLGDQADPQQDCIEVDGQLLKVGDRPQRHYLLLNKPRGYVTTCLDPEQRRTVFDLLPPDLRQGQGLHPVGRLDYASSGALLLTNDGELTARLTHPRYHIAKTYRVWVAGHPSRQTLAQWQEGVLLDGQPTLPAEVEVLGVEPERTRLQIILNEGRNRQIRRVAEQLGHPVLELHRTAIGPLQLGGLRRGAYRLLEAAEVTALQRLV
jgi:23S rRNA pseudouridine2605 synthase